MVHHVHDVRVLERNHALEAGIGLDLDCVIAQEQRNQRKQNQNGRAIVENQPFQKRFRFRRRQVMFALVMHRVGHSKAPLLSVLLLPHQGVIEGSCLGHR